MYGATTTTDADEDEDQDQDQDVAQTRSWRTPNHLRTRRISTQLVGPLLPGRQCSDTLAACTECHYGS